jgi:hypothetical protein
MRGCLESLLAESGARQLASSHFDFSGGAHTGLGFGMALLLLTADSKTVGQGRNMVGKIWER